jgi:hypothetical protein
MNNQQVSAPKRHRIDNILTDVEILREELPTGNFLSASKELDESMSDLEGAYEKRERLIDRIMKDGTGFEKRNALRMLPIEDIEKWVDELESPRKME